MTMTTSPIHFELPQQLSCPLPTEERGVARDEVRLLVSNHNGEDIQHRKFKALTDYLTKGDVLVVNNSATVAAALPIILESGQAARLHLSTQLDDLHWLAEIRAVHSNQSERWRNGTAGQAFNLPEGGLATLITPFYQNAQQLHLWKISLKLPLPWQEYLHQYGSPIKYQNLDQGYPLNYYQTFFSSVPGSAEMPSAARGFTPGIIEGLLQKGVQIIPITLHTGVSSLETGEMPYPESVIVSPLNAARINLAKAKGKHIIAVGTTAVRAIETATNAQGLVTAFNSQSELYIQPGYQMKIIDGLLTGFHEPEASHLYMLQALASKKHLRKAYEAAIQQGYYWHEFGDLHLILNH
ncbi:S-adenosylmethionine:tRNA ribosyltransferase-isomerase [Lewinella cohaerens]|uniref:S-adenosylmethionine:tRNA ribosyltransferase-isomerase n=1 Tax=Lewinella cohaerens TaxID=70995 RepID=UPI0003622113|nr:S-adenosylmethionine:tRNA ribosyltransferase-isomerase [Lewinella cohaerens]